MMIRMVGGWVFLLVPAHPGSPGQRAVKRLLLFVVTKKIWCNNNYCKRFLELSSHCGIKTAGIDVAWRNYVAVTLCIHRSLASQWHGTVRGRSSTGCVQLPRIWTSTGQLSCACREPAAWNSLTLQPCVTKVCYWTLSNRSWKRISSGDYEHRPAPLWRFCELAPLYTCPGLVLTYLDCKTDGLPFCAVSSHSVTSQYHRVKWRHLSVVAIRSPFRAATPLYCV